mmetsp:Transcript_54743/g.61991  ORF Transcript_54743/g.61991 Transcript_54743/m.61991 type:complete len:120 (+) Transcript_54743:157-516(+)
MNFIFDNSFFWINSYSHLLFLLYIFFETWFPKLLIDDLSLLLSLLLLFVIIRVRIRIIIVVVEGKGHAIIGTCPFGLGGWDWCIATPEDTLIKINDTSGHHPGFITGTKGNHPCDLLAF